MRQLLDNSIVDMPPGVRARLRIFPEVFRDAHIVQQDPIGQPAADARCAVLQSAVASRGAIPVRRLRRSRRALRALEDVLKLLTGTPLITPLNDVSDSGGWLTRQPGHPGRLPASRAARPHPRRRPGHARHHPRRHPVAHPPLPHPARPAPPAPRRPPRRSGTPVRSAADDPTESLQPRRHPGRPPAHPGRLPHAGQAVTIELGDTTLRVIDRSGELITTVPRNSLGEITRLKAYGARHSP
jgi:hypothetical protein